MAEPAKITRMWAPIVTGSRSEWPAWPYIRSTRRDAKKAYLEGFEPQAHARVLKNIRFARVTIIEETES